MTFIDVLGVSVVCSHEQQICIWSFLSWIRMQKQLTHSYICSHDCKHYYTLLKSHTHLIIIAERSTKIFIIFCYKWNKRILPNPSKNVSLWCRMERFGTSVEMPLLSNRQHLLPLFCSKVYVMYSPESSSHCPCYFKRFCELI